MELKPSSPILFKHRLATERAFYSFIHSQAYAHVFHHNALKKIIRHKGITKIDFIVITAIYMLNKCSFVPRCSVGAVANFTGLTWSEAYKSVHRLVKRRILMQSGHERSHRKYILMPESDKLIKDYTHYFRQAALNFIAKNGAWKLEED